MINLYEVNNIGIAMIDCGDDLSTEDLESIDWKAVKVGDEIHDRDGNYIGEVSEIGDNAVTVEEGQRKAVRKSQAPPRFRHRKSRQCVEANIADGSLVFLKSRRITNFDPRPLYTSSG